MDHISNAFGFIGTQFNKASTQLDKAIHPHAQRISTYARKNVNAIGLYLTAWAIACTCMGIMYSFNAVAIPLNVGFVCGAVPGVASALIVTSITSILDRDNKLAGKNSIWGLINTGLDRLNQNGVKQALITVVITVAIAFAAISPYLAGGVLAFVVMGHVITQIAYTTAADKPAPKKPSPPKTADIDLNSSLIY